MPPGDVAVLSPYAAQVAEISCQLLQRGESQVKVTAITDSQGERTARLCINYVITRALALVPVGE